ncbi:LysR substrate binding domain protein [Lactobacillus equicursoris DSM 19284 = JCM 14600 = CIP 110162]|uniref:Transcriptional regulator n=1 Tax=Lactobacillus equicursoris DSM 19284 = JCM 14600 = CIP 110162 TaxID=1293597 RepID=K0NS15_9LACO|nr:LysR family transcriptional regulator [Lactobacillus equicursoris]KRL03647.1 transcriptional regulator [Lactobacillus equicursoris DSM 19284 = JCM 14600 = CIP 110162]CCK84939.1 LysR substrate binding domain protein [Lactobacillus equicursoris DSM 19284 = JCM 14600 = CIP 110162]
MRIEHLEIFVSAAETQSFTKTAQNMNMSQPAVSLAISSIEKQLGYQLFSRSRRRMLLTSAGRSLYSSIKNGLNDYRTAVTKAKRIALSEGQVTIRIGLSGNLAEQIILPRLVREYRATHENVNIEFYVDDNGTLFDKLFTHELDLVLSTPEAMPKYPIFNTNNVAKLKWCVLVPTDSPLAEKDEMTDEDLNGSDLVFLDLSCSSPLITLMQDKVEQKCKDSRIFFANNVVAQAMMVMAHQGIAIQPYVGKLSNDNFADLKRIPFITELSSNVSFITAQDSDNQNIVDLLSWMKGQDLI